jgi:hypothetical protein
VQDEAGVRGQPAFDRGGLVGGGVVEHDVHRELVRASASMRCRNFLNSIARCRECSDPMTLPDVMSSAA